MQQTNLLPENASQNDAIFARSVYCRYRTTSQCLASCGCAITKVYTRMPYSHCIVFSISNFFCKN